MGVSVEGAEDGEGYDDTLRPTTRTHTHEGAGARAREVPKRHEHKMTHHIETSHDRHFVSQASILVSVLSVLTSLTSGRIPVVRWVAPHPSSGCPP